MTGPTRLRGVRRALLAAMGLGLLLAGCTDDAPASAPRPTPSATAVPTPAAPAPRPARDVCHEMTYAQAVAPTDSARVTNCERGHTAETFAIGELRTVRAGHLLAVDAAAVQQQVASTCPQRLTRFAGGSRDDLRLSMLRAVWFTPTVEESDAGANWFRCDVIVLAREETLAPVRGRLAGALSTPEGRDRYGMCATAQPGAADFERVICRAPHSWRAISTVALDAGPYPGEEAVRAAGQDICEEAGRVRADDALDYDWGYEWPTAEQWAGGQTYGRCWAPDE